MWAFVIGTWGGAILMSFLTGRHDYGVPVGCTVMAIAITYGWLTI